MSVPAITQNQLDELIRSKLGVADLSDRAAVLTALQRRYPSVAERIRQVGRGLAPTAAREEGLAPSAGDGAEIASAELDLARARVTAWLKEATTSNLLIDEREELLGWLDRTLDDLDAGWRAASQADDAQQRAIALGTVRTLSQRAWSARLTSMELYAARHVLRGAADAFDRAGFALLQHASDVIHVRLTLQDAPASPGMRQHLTRSMQTALDGVTRLLSAGENAAEEIGAWYQLTQLAHDNELLEPGRLRTALESVHAALVVSDGRSRRRRRAQVGSEFNQLNALAAAIASVELHHASRGLHMLVQGITGLTVAWDQDAAPERFGLLRGGAEEGRYVLSGPPDLVDMVKLVRERRALRDRVAAFLDETSTRKAIDRRAVQAADTALLAYDELLLVYLSGVDEAGWRAAQRREAERLVNRFYEPAPSTAMAGFQYAALGNLIASWSTGKRQPVSDGPMADFELASPTHPTLSPTEAKVSPAQSTLSPWIVGNPYFQVL
jgi:hypothetical protein